MTPLKKVNSPRKSAKNAKKEMLAFFAFLVFLRGESSFVLVIWFIRPFSRMNLNSLILAVALCDHGWVALCDHWLVYAF